VRGTLSDLCWIFQDGEEVRGVFVYALARRGVVLPGELDLTATLRIANTVPVDDWVVWCYVVRLPEEFSEHEILRLLERSSSLLLLANATTVWVGCEDSTWNPGVLNPSNSLGNVLGAAAVNIDFIVSCSDGRFDYLDDDVLRRVWDRITSLGVPKDIGAEAPRPGPTAG
jgi:hypothetical protein